MEKTLEEKSKSRGGGTACCVPLCTNSTKRNPQLSFHKFPKEKKLRQSWVHWIGRKEFYPNEYHRVCSEHFPGGKKTYENNIPSISPKLIKPKQSQPRTTFKCRERVPLSDANNQVAENPFMNSVVVDTGVENSDDLRQEIHNLQSELKRLKLQHEAEVNDLKQQLLRSKFSLQRFKDSDSDMEFYTTFPNYSSFKNFVDFLSPACEKLRYIGSKNGNLQSEEQQKRGRKRSLTPEEELFMVLSRLRCGLLERDVANRYDISVSQVSSIWITWLDFLHQRLRSINIWPSRDLVDQTMPPSLKETYPNTRVIVDCTEVFIEMPTAPATQSATFSSYKHHNTAKGLIGISPAGTLSFVSELYAGRTSDRELTNDCGLIELLQPGDVIMADRGFNIDDDLPDDVKANIPPFLNGAQLSHSDEVRTRRIAKERIHVERAIEKIKNFRILQQVIPLSMAADINKIWTICCYLTLFSKPLVISRDCNKG